MFKVRVCSLAGVENVGEVGSISISQAKLLQMLSGLKTLNGLLLKNMSAIKKPYLITLNCG